LCRSNSGAKALALCVALLFASDSYGAVFRGTRAPVSPDLASRMRQYSWREGCPTPIADLTYLRLSHYGYDGSVHDGELVVHKDVADQVLVIFRALFDKRFPIEKMRVIDDYQGSDDASMADNNTSGFNCRFVAGKPGVFSKHSQGRAIDINPRTNPMVTADGVSPPAGAGFVNRRRKASGILRAGDTAVIEFTRRGWTWGGTWAAMKDYQHFEK
jgi:hypothetical protein